MSIRNRTRIQRCWRWPKRPKTLRGIALVVILCAMGLLIGVLVAQCTAVPTPPIREITPTWTPTNTLTPTLAPSNTATATASRTATAQPPTPTHTPTPSATPNTPTSTPTITAINTIPPARDTLPVTGLSADEGAAGLYSIEVLPNGVLDIQGHKCNPNTVPNGMGLLLNCPTWTPTPTDTDTPTLTPTDTPTLVPTDTPTPQPTNTPTITPSPTVSILQPQGQTGWTKLVFDDEMLGATLDPSKWIKRANTQFGLATFTDSQVTVSGGALHLTAIRNADGTLQSGAVSTIGKSAYKYGFYEARMRVPKGSGMWVSWWLKSVNDNLVGVYSRQEIDIMEDRGDQTDRTNMYIHYGTKGNTAYVGSTSIRPLDYSQALHTYGVNWQPSQIDFYVDGEKVWTYTGANVPTDPMNLVLDFAVGSFAGPTDTSAFPAELSIDYLRVWQ